MNEEIISILDKFKKYTQYLNDWKENNKDYSMLKCELNIDEIKIIEDFIYDLQHQLEEKDKLISSLNHQLGKTSETIGKLYSEEYIEKQQLISFLENKITENKELIGKIKSYSATGYGIDIATCKIKMIKEVLDFVNRGGKE